MRIVVRIFAVICGCLAILFGWLAYYGITNQKEDICLIVLMVVLFVLCAVPAYKLWVGTSKKKIENSSWLPDPQAQNSFRPKEDIQKDDTKEFSDLPPITDTVVAQSSNYYDDTEELSNDYQFSISKNTEISFLDAKALVFWRGKRTDFNVPSYYEDSDFGRNAINSLDMFLEKGYLVKSELEKNISLCTIPKLKVVLTEHELKTSGKKADLVNRLLENLSPVLLEDLFPVGVYETTDKGDQAISEYSIFFDNDLYALNLPFYRLKKAKETYPASSNEAIFLKLLSEDIQKCYQEKNIFSYQDVVTKICKIAMETREFDLALDFYILSYFMWCVDIVQSKFNHPSLDTENYFMALNIDRCGKLCNLSFNELQTRFFEVIEKNNPFGLGKKENIIKAFSMFQKALHL